MKKFSRGGNYRKNNFSKSGGGPRKFGGGFRRPAAGEAGERGDGRRLYSATCSVCGAECQVPFRPDGSRPIYCRDCFRQHGGGAEAGAWREDRGPRRQFHKPPRDSGRGAPDQADLLRLLERIESKMDRILEAIGSSEDEE